MIAPPLVEGRLGVITRVEALPRDPGLPPAYVCYRAHVADTRRFASWSADPVGWGSSLGEHAAAQAAAVGEAVERYCGHVVPTDLRTATARALRAAHPDDRVVSPTDLALFAPEQHGRPGFPFSPASDDLEVPWACGVDALDGRPAWVPAAAVHLDLPQDAPLQPSSYAGIATGTSPTDAQARALLELVERDATAVWWASGASARSIDDAGAVTGLLGPTRLQVTLLEVPSEHALPVVVAVVVDPDDDLVALGAACRAHPWDAAVKALVEALGGLRLARELADPGSETWRSVAAGRTPAHVFLPQRTDRRHLDDVGDRYARLVDLPGLAQLAQDPRYRALALPRLHPERTVRLTELRAGPQDPEHLLEQLAGRGLRPVTVDLTTSDVRAAGLVVVRVVVPGLVGNAPPAYPLLGSPRLLDVPRRLGWDRRPCSTRDLFAHPFPLA